ALVREGGTQIVAADPVLAQPRPDGAHERAAEIADGDAVAAVDDGEQHRRDPAGGGVQRLLEAVTDDPAELRPGHDWIAAQKFTMTLPNTCRPSSRARPRSKSASATSVSMTGKRPAAILARAGRMFFVEAANEPKI